MRRDAMMSTGEPLDTNESVVSRFRRLWESSATPPDVFAFLSSSAELSASEQVEVVRIDQRNRWRIGRPLSLKSYLKALPDVASQADLVRILIDGDRRSRRLALESKSPTGGGDRAPPNTSEDRGRGWPSIQSDDTTVPESARHETPTSIEQAVSPIEAVARPVASAPDSTQDGGWIAGAASLGSFALDERHEMAADIQSLRRMLEAMRFTLVRMIGVGGMGVVFEAYDQDRGEIVALKTMRKVDPQALGRFKQEFRSLFDIAHVNLVSLFQLFAVDDNWFFTMELVEGTDFLTHVRGDDDRSAGGLTAERGPAGRRFREDRLRPALIQLVKGVHYLHGCGKLHRDLKPTNVMVAEDGRVVVLDFGLTADFEWLERKGSAERQIVGTAAHMSPEQSAGRETSPASDWYSVGVMLFQALTGRLPFEGSVESVVADKQNRDPPAVEALVDDPPADLAALCLDLLDRRPEARPSGSMILDRLQGRVPSLDVGEDTDRVPRIVGRTRHLRILNTAYESMKSGRIETVFLHGKSGTGKTTILRAFLDHVEKRAEAVVLAGRCHERESVPFKAIDSVIDALVRYLKTLSPLILKPLLPTDVIHLARVFPVLRGVEGVAAMAEETPEPADPQEGRLRAFTGLRDLLARIGARRPLVLAIDDLQWGDADSAVLLADLLYSPDPPVLLFVASFRQEELGSSRFLQILLQIQRRVGPSVSHHDLAVEPLGVIEARELALALLRRDGASALAQAHLIARESAGNPLFIGELVKHVQAGGLATCPGSPGRLDLEDVLMARIDAQTDEAGRMLELVAVSGRPIKEALMFLAGGFGPSARLALVALRSARLVRRKSADSCDAIEIYHDRIRETVLKRLSPELLASWHARLARAYEAEAEVDPEVVAGHLRAAGEIGRARAYHEAAAARAASAFAFDHAARLYRRALEGVVEPAEKRRLLVRLGEVLADAGRGGEAATIYLEAADSATAAEKLDLRRLASSQLLISGRVDEGMKLLRTILKPLGLSIPSDPRLALLLLGWHRCRLRFRGIRFRPREESRISADLLGRIDLCWSAAVGLGVIDPIQGAYFQARGLLLALQSGEPYRIARALAMEAAHEATPGRSASAEVERLTAVAESLAERIDSPHARGIVAMARGSSALLMGDWKRAKESFRKAESQFRNRCVGATWELDTVHILSLWAMLKMGELTAVKERYLDLQREAQDRGDLYAASTLATIFQTFIQLAADATVEHDESAVAVAQAQRRASDGFSLHYLSMVRSRVHLLLYQGRVDDAWSLVEEIWTDFCRSTLSRIQMIRIQITEMRARVALAAAERNIKPEPYHLVVEQQVRRLVREPPCWCEGHIHYLRAGLAASRKDSASALHELGEAARAYAKYDMILSETVMRLRTAQIRGGEQGRTQVESLTERIRAVGVAAPEAWARMIAPGFSRVVSGEADTNF